MRSGNVNNNTYCASHPDKFYNIFQAISPDSHRSALGIHFLYFDTVPSLLFSFSFETVNRKYMKGPYLLFIFIISCYGKVK